MIFICLPIEFIKSIFFVFDKHIVPGMLAVSYALAKGDNFNQGKIHFGLIGEF